MSNDHSRACTMSRENNILLDNGKLASTIVELTTAGVGCRKVRVSYLDTKYKQHFEDVTLNGTTPVSMVATNVFRINSMRTISVGSALFPVGNIKLASGGVTYAYMSAGINRALQAIFTIPDNTYGYITHWQASCGSSSAGHFTQARITSTSYQGVLVPGVITVQDITGFQDNANVMAMGGLFGWLEAL